MAEDDQDRANEMEAEREAEINSEMERVDQDPDQVQEGSENLGRQSAESGTPRKGDEEEPEAATPGGEADEEERDEGPD